MRIEPSLGQVAPPLAARCDGAVVPPGATLVVFGADGTARRPVAFGAKARPALAHGETAWWFVPGPHAVALVPFAGAPEIGLRLDFVIDSADPRIARQRFDLFLFSEVAGTADALTLPDLTARLEGALRGALEQGTLDLPPCTSLDEWNGFRAGLNELLYTRFGITVDDCVPVELDEVDYAAVLRARPVQPVVPQAVAQVAPPSTPPAPDDAAALRRLFLELPEATRTLRLLPASAFATRQTLLQRLSLAALDVNTMPSLALAAPGRARTGEERDRFAVSSAGAAQALDELWALLAQMKSGSGEDGELDRIVANLEYHLGARRGGLP